MPNCPECVAREKKKIQAKYEADTPEEERNREDLNKLFEDVEEVGDIRAKLNQRAYTKEDRQYDYQEWWSKSKKEKQEV